MQPSRPSCQLSASPNTLVYRLQLMNTNGWHWKQAEQCYAKLAAKTNPLCWHLLMALPLLLVDEKEADMDVDKEEVNINPLCWHLIMVLPHAASAILMPPRSDLAPK